MPYHNPFRKAQIGIAFAGTFSLMLMGINLFKDINRSDKYFARHKNDICVAKKTSDSTLTVYDKRRDENTLVMRDLYIGQNKDEICKIIHAGRDYGQLINDNKNLVEYIGPFGVFGTYHDDTLRIALENK